MSHVCDRCKCLAVQIKDGEEKVHRKQERAIMLHLLRNSAPFPFILEANRGITHLNYKVSLIFRKSRKCWMVLLEMCTRVMSNLMSL